MESPGHELVELIALLDRGTHTSPMLPPEEAPIVTRLSRRLDWWFTPPWRAFLTWAALAQATAGRLISIRCRVL